MPLTQRSGIARRIALGGLLAASTAGCHATGHRDKLDPKVSGVAQAAIAPNSKGEAKERDQAAKGLAKSWPAATPGRQFDVHIDLARAFETQGDAESALAEYQKAIDAAATGRRVGGTHVPSARQALAHRKMAGALDRLGRFAQAESHYREALALAPKDAKVWNDAGYSYHLQGRFEDAERSLKQAATLDPKDPRIQTNLGLTLAAAGKTDAALAALTRAAGPATAHANLGYILAATGQADAAREQYRAALAIQPELGAARLALAQLDTDRAKDAASLAAKPPAEDRGVAKASVAQEGWKMEKGRSKRAAAP